MGKIKVAVLRGGPSSEYDISLKTGGSILKNLDTEKYIPHDIFIAKDGTWHVRGIPAEPRKVISNVDVVLNALHGEYGEDGTVQRLLEQFGVPFTGSSALAASVAMNKELTKRQVEDLDVKLAHHRVFDRVPNEGQLYAFFRRFPQPAVVKPIGRGSSVGVTVVNGLYELREAIEKAFSYAPKVLVEEYIRGREATCGVLEGFRGEDVYALPSIEIIPQEGSGFFDYNAKYSGKSLEICPSRFPEQTKRKLEQLARDVHQKLGLRHYSRSDFIVSPRGIYFLEVNTLPGLTEESLLPKSVEAVGFTFPQFLDHVIGLALR